MGLDLTPPLLVSVYKRDPVSPCNEWPFQGIRY